MDFIDFLVIITGTANLLLGFLVLARATKSKVTYSLAGVGIIGGFWAILLFLYHFHIGLPSLLWIKIVYLWVFVMIFNLLYFSLVYPPRIRKSIFLPFLLYIIFAIPLFYILFFTDLWVKDVVHKSWGPETIFGPVYILVCAFWTFFGLWALYNFFRKYIKSTGIDRERIKYILIGLLFFIITVATVDGLIPIVSGDTKLFRISPLSSLFIVGFTAYAILRYRLIDIRLAMGRIAIYVFSFLAVIGLSLGLLYSNSKLENPFSFNILLLLTTVLAVLFYQLFFRLFQKLASRYFYYSFYSSQKVFTELGEKLVKILDISELSNTIAQTLISTMRLDRAVVLFRTNRGRYEILKNIGFKEENGISLVRDNFLTEFLEKTQKPLVFEELSLVERDAKTEKEREGLRKLQGNMKSIEANVCLPLFRGKDITGIVILGKKVSGDSYSREDMELLSTLANQTSIAIENAKLYDEVQDLSQNLQEKVDEQTRELRVAYEELKRINRAKSEFLSMASHQLRTPLTAIKGYLSLIQEGDYGKPTKQMEKPITNMALSTERLIKLVGDLLSISKIELGSMKVDKKPIQIEELLKSCFEEIKLRAEQKNLDFAFQKPKTLLPKIMADELAIRQVMLNLLDNAIRYTEKGSVVLAVEQKADRVLIKVQDTGQGLTKEEQANLFQSFSRGSAGTDLFIEGTGLGLCVAKKYIDLHQGKIYAQSGGKGRGSTFYVELPIAQKT